MLQVSKKRHVTTRQSGRSASQRRRRWPRIQFSWNPQQHRWTRLFQWGTQRWSPAGRRKRPDIFLHQRREKRVSPSAFDYAWMIITASLMLAYRSVNECLLLHHYSFTSVIWQLQVLELSIWHHGFGCEVWGQFSNLSFACSHFHSKQITQRGNGYKIRKFGIVSSQWDYWINPLPHFGSAQITLISLSFISSHFENVYS